MDAIDKINRILDERGLTGADLIRSLGLSSGVYSQWNTRKTKPSKQTLKKIAEVLGVSVIDILPDESMTFHTVPFSDAITQEIVDRVMAQLVEPYGMSNDDVAKMVLFGTIDVDPEILEDVKQYARFVYQRKQK